MFNDYIFMSDYIFMTAATLDMSSTDSTLTVPLLMRDGDASEGTEVDDNKLHFSLGPKEVRRRTFETTFNI